MALPASKRRKLEHSSEDEGDDDGSSFASFGASAEEDHNEIAADEDVAEGPMGLDGIDEETDSEDELELEDVTALGNGAAVSRPKPQQVGNKAPHANRKRMGDEPAFMSGSFKNNVFKLQVDELLEQIRPRHGKREKAAEDALHKLKSTIDAIPARSPLPVEDAEKQLLKIDKVAVPFPNPRPLRDAKYKLEYQKPANINVAGSHALKTASRAKDVLDIDMVLTMPATLFQDKEFLNYRYFYKRAHYLACVAAGVETKHSGQYKVQFTSFHGNPLQPVIAVESLENDAKIWWRINILACVSAHVFSANKLQLEKACLRGIDLSLNGDAQDDGQVPTPFYNSSVRADVVVTPYLKILHSASKTCEAFRDACLLGSTWLRQRGLSSDIYAGGFGNFEWSALMALMLSGGGPKGTPILSPGYSSYQLFKATLRVLAMKDFGRQPLVIGTSDYTPKALLNGSPVVWDAERDHNLLYRLTPCSYRQLRQEAKTTLSMLGDQQYDGFDATFILRSEGKLYKYDCVIEIASGLRQKSSESHSPFAAQYSLEKALLKGLGDRVSQINIFPPKSSSWDTNSRQPSRDHTETFSVGIVVNPETVNRTVDHGPSAEEKTKAAEFRKFWGEKAELRRFKDGSILESLVWSAKEGGQSVLEQVVRYIVLKHIGESVEAGMAFHGDSVKKLLPQANATAKEAYKQMETDIRGLEGLPLSIRQIMPADAQLRSASIHAPLSGPRAMPSDVVIQFEGSGRWPDDLVAIQRTKIAFLLKLSELLKDSVSTVSAARIGLENQKHDTLNQAHLDIIYDSGAAFRMRIYHDREQTLLERQLKDKSLDPRSKEVAALGLAKHKRDYIKAPAHTQAIARLCSRHPALSGTIRLVKKWFASHLIANHVAAEIIELLVAKTFVQPWPWQTPSSVQTGFLRTLFFLSRWDWRAEPLIVDLRGSGGELKVADMQDITTKFEAWRNIDPSLNRVVLFAASNVDREGTTWTDGRPVKVVAGRMTALAKAACAEIAQQGVALEPAGIFASSLEDFDFVVRLDPEPLGRKKGKKGGGFKNLEMEVICDGSLAGYDPVSDFLHELEMLFGAAVLFFSGGQDVIAGLWNPQTRERPWKLNLAYSTIPKAVSGGEDAEEDVVKAEVNKEGILAEIARLGGAMVETVDVNNK